MGACALRLTVGQVGGLRSTRMGVMQARGRADACSRTLWRSGRPLPLSGRAPKSVAFAGKAGYRANYSTRIVVVELRLPEATTRPMMLIA